MPRIDASKLNLEETVVQVRRVSKVVKGGRRFSIRALVVVGDRNGHVGFGLGKAAEYTEAIRKGAEDAKKRLIEVPLAGTTIPFMVKYRFAASEVMLKPAAREEEAGENRPSSGRRGGRDRGDGGDRRGGGDRGGERRGGGERRRS